jgi:hypothetical protein
LQAPPIAPPVAPRAPIDHPGVNSDGTSKIVRHPLASPRSTRVSTGEAESVREAKVLARDRLRAFERQLLQLDHRRYQRMCSCRRTRSRRQARLGLTPARLLPRPDTPPSARLLCDAGSHQGRAAALVLSPNLERPVTRDPARSVLSFAGVASRSPRRAGPPRDAEMVTASRAEQSPETAPVT